MKGTTPGVSSPDHDTPRNPVYGPAPSVRVTPPSESQSAGSSMCRIRQENERCPATGSSAASVLSGRWSACPSSSPAAWRTRRFPTGRPDALCRVSLALGATGTQGRQERGGLLFKDPPGVAACVGPHPVHAPLYLLQAFEVRFQRRQLPLRRGWQLFKIQWAIVCIGL